MKSDIKEEMAETMMAAYYGLREMPEYKKDQQKLSSEFDQCRKYVDAVAPVIEKYYALKSQPDEPELVQAIETAIEETGLLMTVTENQDAGYAAFNVMRPYLRTPDLTLLESPIATLEHCRDVFRHYEQLHAAKPDMEKAKRNAEHAERCETALSEIRKALGESHE